MELKKSNPSLKCWKVRQCTSLRFSGGHVWPDDPADFGKYCAIVGGIFVSKTLRPFSSPAASVSRPRLLSAGQLHGYSDGNASDLIAAAEVFLTGIGGGKGKLDEGAAVDLAGQHAIAVADVAGGEIRHISPPGVTFFGYYYGGP